MAGMTRRNWRDQAPYVGHESAIIWPLFRARGTAGKSDEEAPLRGMSGFTLHMMQGGRQGDYHSHEDAEQVYYFIKGRGKMRIDGELIEVQEGDAVHLPPESKHQLINDTRDWIEHILVTAPVRQG